MTPFPIEPADARGPVRVVLTTYPSLEVAQAEADRIVGQRLAACAHLFPVRSRYWWKGRVERAEEFTVVYKTAPKRVGALFRAIARGHPYEVPEIVELDVPRVHPPYLDWLLGEVAPVPRSGERRRPLGLTRPEGPRGPGVPRPGRRRALHPRPSRGT